MNKLRVGFDLDGVLYDFGNSVRRYLDSVGRPYGFLNDADEPHHWDFYEYWGMTREEFVKVCHAGADAGYIFCGPVRDNAVNAVNAVKDAGHEIIVITDRQFGSTPQVSHNNTERWWNTHFPAYDELYYSADKKVGNVDIMVEDKLENYDDLVSNGIPCVLINRLWNEVEGGDARHRINDISDYLDVVNEMAKKGYVDLALA